jgi:DNA-binding transcriptional MocR family regulator
MLDMDHPAPLYRQLADQVHDLIQAGTLRAGDRMPSVRRLSRQRQVSVSTVLQAYQRLEDLGAIEARPQSGFYVRSTRSLISEPDPGPSMPAPFALTVEVNALADAVLAAAADPRMVSFGSACPHPDMFPLDRIRRTVAACARRHARALGRYGEPPGSEVLRRVIARRALDWGCRIDHRNLVLTGGCMESINLGLRATTRPGDMVAVETPTYYGFLQILETLGLRALEIPTHPRNGMSVEALALALSEHDIRAVLAIPNVSNPLGASMPDTAKKRIVDMLSERAIPLIEDHIYADLHGDTSPPRAAKSWDRTGNVMLVSSFSKTLAPGLKAGWIEPGRWRDRVRTLKFVASGGQSELQELAVAELIEFGGHDRFLRGLRRRFEAHVESARRTVAESFPKGTRLTRPSGGFVLWVEMPSGYDALQLFERALGAGIAIAPGPMFSATQRYGNCLRLSLGEPWSARIEAALRELGRLAHLVAVRKMPD